MSTTQVQRELGLSRGQVEALISSGRLPAFRIFGQWRIERELLEWMVDDLYARSIDFSSPPGSGIDPNGSAWGGEFGPDDVHAASDDVAVERTDAALPGLTVQQRRIARLVAQGMSNAEIGATLAVEVSTVKTHVSRILLRCNLRDREQLIVLAWRTGLAQQDLDAGATPSASKGCPGLHPSGGSDPSDG